MISRDYIQRLIEEFAKFLAAVMRLRKEGNFDGALKETRKIYTGVLDLEPETIQSILPDNLLEYLREEKELSNSHLKMVAELLYEEGLVYTENGDPVSAYNVLNKSKIVIQYLMDHDNTFDIQWYEKLNHIDEIIPDQ